MVPLRDVLAAFRVGSIGRISVFVSVFFPAPSTLALGAYWVFCHGYHHKHPLRVPQILGLLTKGRMVSLPCLSLNEAKNFSNEPTAKRINKPGLNEYIADTQSKHLLNKWLRHMSIQAQLRTNGLHGAI